MKERTIYRNSVEKTGGGVTPRKESFKIISTVFFFVEAILDSSRQCLGDDVFLVF